MEIQVRASHQLVAVSRALKDADKALTRELLRGLQRATKDIRADMKRSAYDNLPREGGLNEEVAGSRFSTQTRRTGRDPGVRIAVLGKRIRDMRSLDAGRLRHPVYGNRDVWVNQSIPPGVFSIPFEQAAPAVRREVVRVMDDVAAQIAKKGD